MCPTGSLCFSNNNMKAKFINEGLENILSPKSDEDIINSLASQPIKKVIADFGDKEQTWKAIEKRGVSPEELFRIAFESGSGIGIDYAIKRGAKGTLLSDSELLDGFIKTQTSSKLFDLLKTRVSETQIFDEVSKKLKDIFKYSHRDFDGIIPFIIKFKNKIPSDDLINALNEIDREKPSLMDALISEKIFKPKELFYGLRNKTDWQGRTSYNPNKTYILSKFPEAFEQDFLIKEAVKYNLTEIIKKVFDHLSDVYTDERILNIALKTGSTDLIRRALANVDLSKIKPNKILYNYFADQQDSESIKVLLKNPNNPPALLNGLERDISTSNTIIKNLFKNAKGAGGITPNAKQGAGLKEAIKTHDMPLIKRYMEHPNISQNTIYTSFWTVCEIGNKEIIQYFLNDRRVNPIDNFPECLERAAKYGNVETMIELVNDDRVKNHGRQRSTHRGY